MYDNKSLEYGLPSDMVKLLSSYYDLANERRLNFDYEIRRGECSTTEHNIFMTTELIIYSYHFCPLLTNDLQNHIQAAKKVLGPITSHSMDVTFGDLYSLPTTACKTCGMLIQTLS